MRVSIQQKSGLNYIAKTRQFTDIQLDEPESFHGTDQGPSSVEYFLIGIGGCLGTTFAYCLQKENVNVDDLIINIDGTLKHTGSQLNLEITQVDVSISFKSQKDSDEVIIKNCIEKFQKHCIVSNSILSGFPINVKFS